MHTPQEQEFYDDLAWLVRRLRVASAAMHPDKLKEITMRYERMKATFHDRAFTRIIDMD